jgi:uncharacterized protein
MRILFFPITPAQIYTSLPIIKNRQKRGHETFVLVRDHDVSLSILKANSIEYHICGKAGKKGYTKYFEAIPLLTKACALARKFKPDCIFGYGSPSAIIGLLFHIPAYLLGDSDMKSIQLLLIKHNPYVKAIFTPKQFKLDLGKAHLKLDFYKELLYLHPDIFRPDENILIKLGVKRDDKFAIIRFNAFDAVHDIGLHGFESDYKRKLFEELSKYMRVFISSESILPDDLSKNLIPIEPYEIHHALYYSSLFVCDTGTMATEAVVLGTPTVMCHPLIKVLSNFVELEERYGLIACYVDPGKAINKAVEFASQFGIKEEWNKKRAIMLQQKHNITEYIVDYLEAHTHHYKEKTKAK